MTFFTICSNNYLAQALALGQSLKKYNPTADFYIFLADKTSKQLELTQWPQFKIVECAKLALGEKLESVARRHDIVEFNTLLKPFCFEYLFKQTSAKTVVYLDPDTAVFASFDELTKLFREHEILLTPHMLQADLKNSSEWERLVLKVGIYNLGFLGLKNTKNTQSLLGWWGRRLLKYCSTDFNEGLFVDQIWANHFPVFFPKTHVINDPGYNMGYWNFSERKLEKKKAHYYVNGRPLIFFHFSSFNPLRPHILCEKLDYSFDRRQDLKILYVEYAELVLQNNFSVFSKLRPGLPFRNKDRYKLLRKLYRWLKKQARRGF
jgi:lipopolysaccharide biosynthesis glycosyltransferase